MSFKDLHIKSCYESGVDDIIEDYYVPVLGSAIHYDRIAGFFSSSSLAIAARGLSEFIQHGGKMRLITSPRLNSDDIEIVKKIASNASDLTLDNLGIDVDHLEDEFEKNHVKALGWMLSTGLLEMKLAIVYNEDGTVCGGDAVAEKGLFHQKVGILRDVVGHELSFSGSINETATAWVDNDEEFKVFKDWTDSCEYFKRDKQRFEELWYGERKNVKVFDLPQAVKSDIVRYSSDFDSESISLKKYRHIKDQKYDFKRDRSLFFYQADALNLWKRNGYRMLFEMATGTGKTRTAIAGIKYLNRINKRLITIVSTPQNTLSKQWKKEVEGQHLEFDKSEIVDGSVPKWNNALTSLLYQNAVGLADHVILFTTHNTASSEKFITTLSTCLHADTSVLFVGDETHWLGARQFQKALLPIYKYRIGLSATPSRWYDDSGTKKLTDFYGGASFDFSIKDALTEFNPLTGKHFLVNYRYKISKVPLDEEESREYRDITAKLVKLSRMKENNPDVAERVDRLLEKRAKIVKNASAKYPELNRILSELSAEGEIDNLLVFVSPEQIEAVMGILAESGLIFHKLTEKEGTKPEKRFNGKSEREHIIEKFRKKEYQAIVAMKCMDEGIDIPTADTGILMASNTNPREYIQRVGRIIRQSPGKQFAHLYDICVDTISGLDLESADLERKIRAKEQVRLKEIAANAINSIEALKIINSLD